jgi:hypothetical protein
MGLWSIPSFSVPDVNVFNSFTHDFVLPLEKRSYFLRNQVKKKKENLKLRIFKKNKYKHTIPVISHDNCYGQIYKITPQIFYVFYRIYAIFGDEPKVR